MRIVIHDYAGHPFQIQLSRCLAARGHRVTHLYCEQLLTPRGPLSPRRSDAPTLSIGAVPTRGRVDKTTLLRRRAQELGYALRLRSLVAEANPEVVLSGNAPLDAQRALLGWCKRRGRRFVFWLQDLIGVGARRVLAARFGRAGGLLGAYLEASEGRLLRGSSAVVAITDDFVPWLMRCGVRAEHCRVVPNWAPLDDLPERPRTNPWSLRHHLERCRVLLYSGTLGMKHNPALLWRLAEHLEPLDDVRVVVVSEGPGADWLRSRLRQGGPRNLLLLPFQPFEELPDVLGSAEVLLSILEPAAGAYSVPSKVLTSLCAGRALLLAVPGANLAARWVTESGAGWVVDPRDAALFVASAERLLADGSARSRMGERARAFAVREFDIERIASVFEEILEAAPGSRSVAHGAASPHA